MAGRLHQLAPAAFFDTVPGPEPTAAQRLRFDKPVIRKEVNSELRKLAAIFNKSMVSVLEVAATNTLRVIDTAGHKAAHGYHRPIDALSDVGFYLDTTASRSATDFTTDNHRHSPIPLSKQHVRNLGTHHMGRPSWHSIVVPVELEWGSPSALYAENSGSHATGKTGADGRRGGAGTATPVDAEPNGEPQGEITLGQFAEYQLNVFTHQHRCFLYGIHVRKKGARMIYCDRTGARVSEEFDWTSGDSFLHTFVWKLAHMSLEQLGFDPTAGLATDAECVELQTARGDSALPQHVVEAVNNAFDKHYPVYRLRITLGEPFPDEAFPAQDPITLPSREPSTSPQPATPLEQPTKKEHDFLVARPFFHTDALVGRCTKCYIAYDLDGQRFCFLKDYWRPLVTKRARPEHLVYERLKAARTRFIATLICGGDVGGPRSQTTQVQGGLPRKNRPIPLVHYRIAVEEIGRPLKTFNGFRHLANIFAQAITAHDHAVKYAGVLHGDISVGNIMIKSDGDGLLGDGFLIDWDLSQLISELDTGPIVPGRAGTWQFQSALSLRWPRKPYRVSDDIESFIHAFRYMVLRHHVTTVVNLYSLVNIYFDCCAYIPAVFDDGVRVVKCGGDEKFLHCRCLKSGFTVKGNPKLQTLLDNIARRCYDSYAAIDRGRMNSLYGLPERVPDNQQERQHSAPLTMSSETQAWITTRLSNRQLPVISPSAISPPVISPPATPSTPPTDPCDISGFLADPHEVIGTFMNYVLATSSQADQDADAQSKAPDEFKRRDPERPQVNFLPPLPIPRSSSLSTSDTQDSTSSASDVLSPAALDNRCSSSPGAPSNDVPSRDPSPHPSAPPSRATSHEPSIVPSSNGPSRQGSPLPGVPPIAGPSSLEDEVPPRQETLGKRRGRTSDVVEAVSSLSTARGATDSEASKALPKPSKKARN